jgi:hypothetical protein
VNKKNMAWRSGNFFLFNEHWPASRESQVKGNRLRMVWMVVTTE